MEELEKYNNKIFEEIKHIDKNKNEYWDLESYKKF